VERDERFSMEQIFVWAGAFDIACYTLLHRRDRQLRSEIARREASEENATKLSRHDPLTGLPNRRVLGEDLAEALGNVGAKAAECAVFLIDLDRFKPINDAYGHAVGDAVLVEVARRITEVAGVHGSVARMGGDEFACVIPYEIGSDLPARLGGQIVRSLDQPILVEGARFRIGSTIGIARAPQDGIEPSVLLRGADLAMYEQKREGRGTYRFFHAEMDTDLRSRSALEADLRLAVAAGEIVPHFQPVMNLQEDRIIGFEALARWNHPTRGMIVPDTFIPVSEDLGIIDEVTYAILRASCLAARDWPPSLWLAINISPVQLQDPWLASRLLAILTETGLAPGRLILEVTENAVIDDIMKARAVFASLQNAGVRIALDDFGKGYSSLHHLQQLHFDHLKIDRSFVHSMESSDSATIVGAVTGLGKSLGMTVTAEGVETIAEADALRALGCEQAQGFLFGKPLDAAGTLAMLNATASENVTFLRSA
jgi:diguanylate cyclase (GGDEF)-like protein